MLGTPHNPGIMGNTFGELFQHITEASEEVQFQIKLSYLEIYNENIRDLLVDDPSAKPLDLREDSQ